MGKLDDAGCRIVTRFKKNTPLRLLKQLRVPEGGAVLCDRIAFLPARQKHNRSNPFHNAVREVRVKTDTGKVLRIRSNDLDATAQQIAVALIAFLLLRLAKAAQNAVQSPLAFARLVRANLMHRRRIDQLLQPKPIKLTNSDQMALQWT